MQTVIVIPCHNEARLIERTARSLGFGSDAPPPTDTRLVLVENVSTDNTWAALSRIQARSPAAAVIAVREPELGYVPPRHRGTLIARELAAAEGIHPDELLILQGDGDTVYEPGYVDAMRVASLHAGRNCMVEATTHSPHRFLHDHPGFQALADEIDVEMERFAVPEQRDVIIDDKVAGYRLGDYNRWGGHRRDFTSRGAEVHAETTRLYIRALRAGATKVRASNAFAQPSRRKIQRNPVRHFASAGFPREEAWWRDWNAHYSGPNNLSAFDDPGQIAALQPAVEMRRAHLLALFSSVPRAVDSAFAREMASKPNTMTFRRAVGALLNDDLGMFFELLLPKP